MQAADKTIDHGTLRRLVEAGATVDARVIGAPDGWGLVIDYGRVRQTLAATRGQPRIFKRFETLASYLKALGIADFLVNVSAFEPTAPEAKADDKRSSTAAKRMRETHQGAAYDKWFREQVQASLDDPRPNVADADAEREFAARRETLKRRIKATR